MGGRDRGEMVVGVGVGVGVDVYMPRDQFSLSTTCVPGNELRSSAFVASKYLTC